MNMRFGLLCLVFILATSPIELRAEANRWLFATLLEEKKIVSFERGESGELIRRTQTECTAEPACMAVSPDRSILFVSYRSTGQLASFRIDRQSGQLTAVSVVEGGADPAYLLPDATGRFLLSAYYVANKVCVHEVSADGSINAKPLQNVPTADKAHGLTLDESNRFLFVPHTGANRIYQFRFDEQNGQLSPNQPAYIATPDEDHPRHLAKHPSDRWAYVSNESGDTLGVFAIDKRNGTLRRIQTLSTLPDGFDGARNSTARCEISPDGRFVYVANRGHDSIACFSIDQSSGRASSLGQVPTEKTPRSFTIESAGRFLYAAGQDSGKIATYRIESDGRLRRVATTASGPVSWWVLAVDVPEP